MSSKTTNLNLTKPSEDEFYDINVQNENMDIIDREINGLKQPAYEVSTAMSDLHSGEMITVAFGKIAKAVSTLISHTTSKATNSVLGHVKLSDSTSSTSASTAGVAATPKAVKAAYDLANSNTKKIGTTDISGIGDGTVTGAIAENKDAIEDVTQSLNKLNEGIFKEPSQIKYIYNYTSAMQKVFEYECEETGIYVISVSGDDFFTHCFITDKQNAVQILGMSNNGVATKIQCTNQCKMYKGHKYNIELWNATFKMYKY